MEKYKTGIILTVLLLTAFACRWYLMPGHFFFGPEQGRDFLVIRDIVENHKFTLIGSKTDIPGIFHGPVYYYIAAIPYFLSRGNPVTVFAFFTVIQSISVLLVYMILTELTGKKRTGFIGAAVFSVSFLFVVYSRWLSNPPLSIPLSLALMYSLIRYVRGKDQYLIAVSFLYGLLGQAEFINFLLFFFILALTFILTRKRVSGTKPMLLVVSLGVALISSIAAYVIFDLRHQSIIFHSVIGLIEGKSGYRVPLVISAVSSFRVLTEQVGLIAGLSGWIAGTVVTVLALICTGKKIVSKPVYTAVGLWVIVPPLIFALLGHNMLEQLYSGVIAGFIILIALAVDTVWEKSRIAGIAVLIIFLGVNATALIRNLPDNHMVFFQQQQPVARYTDQLMVIDWMYKEAAGRPYSFEAYTIPYFFQDAWVYLLGYYGGRKYGYVPDNKGRKLHYVVIQKDNGDPNFQNNWHREVTSAWGTMTRRTQIGDLTIEEWTL